MIFNYVILDYCNYIYSLINAIITILYFLQIGMFYVFNLVLLKFIEHRVKFKLFDFFKDLLLFYCSLYSGKHNFFLSINYKGQVST